MSRTGKIFPCHFAFFSWHLPSPFLLTHTILAGALEEVGSSNGSRLSLRKLKMLSGTVLVLFQKRGSLSTNPFGVSLSLVGCSCPRFQLCSFSPDHPPLDNQEIHVEKKYYMVSWLLIFIIGMPIGVFHLLLDIVDGFLYVLFRGFYPHSFP